MRIILSLLLVLCFTSLSAGVYKWVDANGQVHYSDQPTRNSEQVQLRESTVIPSPPPPVAPASSDAGSEAAPATTQVKYKGIQVVAPEDDQPLRSNDGQVPISIELRPGLAKDHKIRIYLDGAAASGELDTTQITLQNVDRGTHTLAAAVVDASGKELLRSSEVTFHLLRQSAVPRAGG